MTPQDSPSSAGIFPAPALESVTSTRYSDFFCWRMAPELKIGVLSMLVANKTLLHTGYPN